jgi:hypothetical protein
VEELSVELSYVLEPGKWVLWRLDSTILPSLRNVFFRSVGVHELNPNIIIPFDMIDQPSELLLGRQCLEGFELELG